MNNVRHIIIISLYLFISCSFNKNETTYELSHGVINNDTSQIIPAAPNSITLVLDSVYIYDYEPYIPVKKGILKNNCLIISEHDTIYFEIKDNYLITSDNDTSYYWKKVSK